MTILLDTSFLLALVNAKDRNHTRAIHSTDLQRVVEILEQYSDSHLDLVDATIIAIAERLNVSRIFTFDQRDFTVIRPKHCVYFEILP